MVVSLGMSSCPIKLIPDCSVLIHLQFSTSFCFVVAAREFEKAWHSTFEFIPKITRSYSIPACTNLFNVEQGSANFIEKETIVTIVIFVGILSLLLLLKSAVVV